MTTQQETLSLDGELRDTVGKAVRFLRRQGITPANLYGKDLESISLQVPTQDLERVLHQGGRSSLVTLSIGDQSYQTLLRSLQRHPVSRAILHADFHRVDMSHSIQTQVQVHLVGEAPASKLPDVLITHLLHEVTIECLPGSIPSAIEVDISGLTDFDMSVHIQDVEPPSGVTFLTDGEQMIVRVGQSRVAAATAAMDEVAGAGVDEAAADVETTEEGAGSDGGE